MRVALLGGAGLLGSALVRELSRFKHEVFIVDNFSGSMRFRTPKEIPIFSADLCNLNATSVVFKKIKPDVVIVTSNYFFSLDVIYKPYEDTRSILNTVNNLVSLLDNSVKQVVYCSSSEVYGGPEPRKPVAETRKIVSPANHRGAAFMSAETMLEYRCSQLGVPLTVARIFELYGNRIMFNRFTGKVSFIVDSMLRHEQIGLVGAKSKRDFIHAEDAASLLSLFVENGVSGTFNIGSGVPVTLLDICEGLSNVIEVPYPPLPVPDRGTVSYSAIADLQKVNKVAPKWEPKHSVLTDLKSLVDFRRSEIFYYSRENAEGVLRDQRGY